MNVLQETIARMDLSTPALLVTFKTNMAKLNVKLARLEHTIRERIWKRYLFWEFQLFIIFKCFETHPGYETRVNASTTQTWVKL